MVLLLHCHASSCHKELPLVSSQPVKCCTPRNGCTQHTGDQNKFSFALTHVPPLTLYLLSFLIFSHFASPLEYAHKPLYVSPLSFALLHLLLLSSLHRDRTLFSFSNTISVSFVLFFRNPFRPLSLVPRRVVVVGVVVIVVVVVVEFPDPN